LPVRGYCVYFQGNQEGTPPLIDQERKLLAASFPRTWLPLSTPGQRLGEGDLGLVKVEMFEDLRGRQCKGLLETR
jgi:hypothetical protein